MSAALFSSDLTLHDSFSCACVIVKLVDWLKALINFRYLLPRVRFAACNLLVNHPGFAVQLYFACIRQIKVTAAGGLIMEEVHLISFSMIGPMA